MKTTMRGYTLLELIVSVGIFSIIMLAATSAYLTLINLDKEARSVGDVVTNLSFAADSMARAIRTGSEYRCNDAASEASANCTSTLTPGSSFSFQDVQTPSRKIVYSLSNGQIMAAITTSGTTVTSAITDSRVRVTALNFYVRGVGDESPAVQPQVTFTITGEMATGPGSTEKVSFTMQSSATQRLLEL